GRLAEAACLCALAATCAWLLCAFTPRTSHTDPPLAFLSIVPLVWAAFRFGALGTSTVAVLLSTVTAWATARGSGQFALANMREGLLLLWAYMTTLGGMGLMITALQANRLRMMAELAKSRTMLDAIRRAQSKLIVEMDARATMDELLRSLAAVTDSEFV